jgi:hypothetical protein
MPEVVVALLTPFHANGSSAKGARRAGRSSSLLEGDSLMPCGTTEEGPLRAELGGVVA